MQFFKRKSYKTWQDAAKACKKLGLKKPIEYKEGRKKDSRLPESLNKQYDDFPGWTEFFK